MTTFPDLIRSVSAMDDGGCHQTHGEKREQDVHWSLRRHCRWSGRTSVTGVAGLGSRHQRCRTIKQLDALPVVPATTHVDSSELPIAAVRSWRCGRTLARTAGRRTTAEVDLSRRLLPRPPLDHVQGLSWGSTTLNPWRRRPDSNRGTGLCRPLPKPLGHAAVRAGRSA
jgi:hypothetical protein